MSIKVVRVLRENRHKERKFIGTAFFVNKNTLITAKHVVEEYLTSDYKIYLTEMPYGGNVLVSPTQIELCPRDIAVIKTQREYNTISAVSYFDELDKGVKVNIQGFHDEDGEECLYQSPISGYTNAPHTFEIQDSRTNGLSGSPVIVDGKICGIAQAISPEKNITYIIPISEVCDKSIFEQEETFDIHNFKELKAVKELLKNMPIEQLKAKVYKYLPISYFLTLPNTVEKIIDELLSIGVINGSCVPILSVFEEHTHKDVMAFVDYIKIVKFKNIEESKCREKEEVSELSFLINFLEQDGKTELKIETWRYSNGETHQILTDFSQINLDIREELNKFLDAIYEYANEAVLIYKSKIFIEIILPNEKLFESIKTWKNSTGNSLIREYKYIFRMQSRFKKPDDKWKSKWNELDITKSNIRLNDKFKSRYIEKTMYTDEVVAENYSVILQEKIANPNVLFEDIEAFGIPIVISSLSSECNVDEVRTFEFKECQEKICNYIMLNHNNHQSDIFFMIDNPNKIPDEFKNPNENLYEW